MTGQNEMDQRVELLLEDLHDSLTWWSTTTSAHLPSPSPSPSPSPTAVAIACASDHRLLSLFATLNNNNTDGNIVTENNDDDDNNNSSNHNSNITNDAAVSVSVVIDTFKHEILAMATTAAPSQPHSPSVSSSSPHPSFKASQQSPDQTSDLARLFRSLPLFHVVIRFLISQISPAAIRSISNVAVPEDNFLHFLQEFLLHSSEVSYPYSVSRQILSSLSGRVQVIEFLLAELQAERLLMCNKSSESEVLHSQTASVHDIETTEFILRICHSLCIDPNNCISPSELVASIQKKVDNVLATSPNYMGARVFSKDEVVFLLSKSNEFGKVAEYLREDYTGRISVLRKRLEVTLQAFLWSSKGKENKAEIDKLIDDFFAVVDCHITPRSLYEVANTHTDIAVCEKVSANNDHNLSLLKDFKIGEVPDRGGRPSETRPDPRSYHHPGGAAMRGKRYHSHRQVPDRGGRPGETRPDPRSSGGAAMRGKPYYSQSKQQQPQQQRFDPPSGGGWVDIGEKKKRGHQRGGGGGRCQYTK